MYLFLNNSIFYINVLKSYALIFQPTFSFLKIQFYLRIYPLILKLLNHHLITHIYFYNNNTIYTVYNIYTAFIYII